ncbi:MAG: DnaJ domain-containing protein [Deltaproteobacteria bacterium]|nr:DnaJ domain-containing protein [Deltaproteobacteria bacterium]
MAAWKDYYRILQVEAEADQTTLKKAYHKLAVIWHPDRNPDSSVAEERFKAIAEAYAVLSDPLKRQRYDQLGPDNFASEYGTADIFQGFDLSDLFREFGLPPIKETLFGILSEDEDTKRTSSGPYQDFFSEFGQKAGKNKRPGKSPPLAMTLAISLKEAVFGAIKPAAFNAGSGVVKVSLTIPHGARHGQLLTVKNRVPGSGRQPGDLMVTLNVTPEPTFRRVGQDLLTTINLTRDELSGGCRPLVPTLDGKTLKLAVAAGTKSGSRLKASGHGVPGPDGKRGDLLITVMERYSRNDK